VDARAADEISPAAAAAPFSEIPAADPAAAAVAEQTGQPDAEPNLPFPPDLVTEYAVAVHVSPLVILAGPSGAGKTRLTRDYAASIGAEYTLIAVRPDWRANEDLLGYLPPFEGGFVPHPFTTFVAAAEQAYRAARAAGRTPRAYHCCLDEMNLARPEYYLAEVLSKLELEPDDRVLHLYEATTERGYPKRLALPPNLVLIGTVNNDDTTYALSPKVLDRAVYLNIDSIDLGGWFARRAGPAAELAGPVLIELDGILREASFRVGYRVAAQVVRWIEEAVERGVDRNAGLDTALATMVLAKLRLQRSEPTHRQVLDRVRVYLETLAGPDENTMPRSLALVRRLSAGLDRREFVYGQFETS
jgi:MoxR-like ATPase